MLSETPSNRTSIGLIGCGSHLLSAHVLPCREQFREGAVTVTGAFDPASAQMDAISVACPRAIQYRSLEQLLRQPELSGVFIGSPDPFHADQTLQSISAGKHVFVEKPLAVDSSSLQVALCAIREARDRKLSLLICHPKRFDPVYEWVRDFITNQSNEFDGLKEIHVTLSAGHPAGSWSENRWIIFDHVSHQIDLVHYLTNTTALYFEVIRNDFLQYEISGKLPLGTEIYLGARRALDEAERREVISIRFNRGHLTVEPFRGFATLVRGNSETVTFDLPRPQFNHRSKAITEHAISMWQHSGKVAYLAWDDVIISASAPVALSARTYWDVPIGTLSLPGRIASD